MKPVHYTNYRYNNLYGSIMGYYIACGANYMTVRSSVNTGRITCKNCKKTWIFKSDNYV